MSKKSGFGKLLLGLGAGVGLGLLFAPKKGSETREDLKNKFNELLQKVKEIDVQEVKCDFEKKINKLEKELKDLDKEKVLKIAKNKSEEIKGQIEDLYEMAKKEGTEVVLKAVEDLRGYAIKVTKDVLVKLEKKEEIK